MKTKKSSIIALSGIAAAIVSLAVGYSTGAKNAYLACSAFALVGLIGSLVDAVEILQEKPQSPSATELQD
ncbi:hypothetical protein IFO70_33250 [Phormidium tenue FACHB-886]|nr:hypothetical protein [Phormidium tenue FACHB-886]